MNWTTELRFVGDWALGAAVVLALLLGAIVWWWYRRETQRLAAPWRWLLPTLRAVAVALLVLILAGPVLHHRRTIGELARVLVFVDTSRSMLTTDNFLEPARKLFAVRALGWIPKTAFRSDLLDSATALGRARSAATATNAPAAFLREIKSAYKLADNAPTPTWKQTLDRFETELLKPARNLVETKPPMPPPQQQAQLKPLAEAAGRWQEAMRAAFTNYVQSVIASSNATIVAALQRFDAMPRRQRMELMLLDEDRGLLPRLVAKHQVELWGIADAQPQRLWTAAKGLKLPAALPEQAAAASTDLGDGLQELLGEKQPQRVVAVLFSDGQHNLGRSPVDVAKLAGVRAVPIFTIGLGGAPLPPDLAVAGVEVPEAVNVEDKVRGTVLLKDDMPAGQAFTVRITDGGKTVWEKELVTDRSHRRKVEFDFPIKALAEARRKDDKTELQYTSFPLALEARISDLAGEKDQTNNVSEFRFRAVGQRRKVMLIDGRPRWEFRYLRNLFERDPQWQVNVLLAAGPAGAGSGWKRGEAPGQFPGNRDTLFSYDLIILGEVPPGWINPPELEWLRDFVSDRGGGLIGIDGQRGLLRALAAAPALRNLFPVEWLAAPASRPTFLRLAEQTTVPAPFNFASDPAENAALWRKLPPPHWIAATKALPGTDLLVEAVAAKQPWPAMVHRQFGAGQVLYVAFDESWRWRYDVAEKYHDPFWSQLVNWVAEPPFAVRDKFVALDAGRTTYRPGEVAAIRVRLRDADGRATTRPEAVAILSRAGRKVATIKLSPEDRPGGVYRGQTAALEPGDYDVSVQTTGLPQTESLARASFNVRHPAEASELSDLNCNEELLAQMARASGGEYYHEEDAGALAQRLEPYSQGRIEETETVLWQSWWWFIPVIGLLTTEWILRKRTGLI